MVFVLLTWVVLRDLHFNVRRVKEALECGGAGGNGVYGGVGEREEGCGGCAAGGENFGARVGADGRGLEHWGTGGIELAISKVVVKGEADERRGVVYPIFKR
jgi:hypothetical protein